MLFYGSYVQVIRTCGRSSSIEGNISLFDAVCAIVWIGISLMIYYAIIFAMVVRRYINPQLSLLLWVLLVVVTMLYLYFQYIFRNLDAPPSSIGTATHGAVFYGKSNDGTIYVYTKNGWEDAPRIMKLRHLNYDGRLYGRVQGIGNDIGYYKKK